MTASCMPPRPGTVSPPTQIHRSEYNRCARLTVLYIMYLYVPYIYFNGYCERAESVTVEMYTGDTHLLIHCTHLADAYNLL